MPDDTRVLELEITHPQTGRPLRLYDTRRLDRVAQVQASINEVEQLGPEGNWEVIHRSATSIRWIYKHEMELLLRVAGFARWEIYGGFDRRALTRETDGMIVEAWRG